MKLKPSLPLYSSHKSLYAGALLLLGLTLEAHAQTSIYTASYGGTNNSGGGTAQSSGSYTLNTFTVTGVYTAGSSTTETVFITDGTATGRIYGSQTTLASLTVGTQATASIVDSVYQGTEEFKTPTNVTVTGTAATPTPVTGMLSQVAATVTTSATANPFTAGPSDSLYASEGNLLLAPVTFSITPNASGTLSTTGSTTLTDASTGDAVILYKSANALAYTAGTAYTVVGFEQPYNGSGTVESEIVGTSSLTAAAVPEPSVDAILGLGMAALGFVGYRTRRSSLA